MYFRNTFGCPDTVTAASCFEGDFLAGNDAVDLDAVVLSGGKCGQRLK